jgi:hypothetical protein
MSMTIFIEYGWRKKLCMIVSETNVHIWTKLRNIRQRDWLIWNINW